MKYQSKEQNKGRASEHKRGANQVYVMPVKGGWVVRKGLVNSSPRIHATKAAATKEAKESLRTKGSGELRVHGRDGRIQNNYVVSRDDFEKISAVEGLYFSAEMKQDFNDFDRRGQSDGQRRKTIVNKYAKPRV